MNVGSSPSSYLSPNARIKISRGRRNEPTLQGNNLPRTHPEIRLTQVRVGYMFNRNSDATSLANATTESDAIAREVSRSRRNRTLVCGTFLVLAIMPSAWLDIALGAPVFTTTVLAITALVYCAKVFRYKGRIPKEGNGFSLSGDIASVSSKKATIPTVVGYKVGPNHLVRPKIFHHIRLLSREKHSLGL